jgi:hypothetical protein
MSSAVTTFLFVMPIATLPDSFRVPETGSLGSSAVMAVGVFDFISSVCPIMLSESLRDLVSGPADRSRPSMEDDFENESGPSPKSHERAKAGSPHSISNDPETMDVEMEESNDAEEASEKSSSFISVDFVGFSDVSGSFSSGEIVKVISACDGLTDEEISAAGVELNYVKDHDMYQLRYKACTSDVSSKYKQKILKVGSNVQSESGSCAKISYLDAEWHRNQPWALPTKYLGSRVRISPIQKYGALKKSLKESADETEINGTVWGWLPKTEMQRIEKRDADIWRILLEDDEGASLDLTHEELIEAIRRYEIHQGVHAISPEL